MVFLLAEFVNVLVNVEWGRLGQLWEAGINVGKAVVTGPNDARQSLETI